MDKPGLKYPDKYKRDAYNEMLKWKSRRDKRSGHGARALEIRGARQVGKTTLINDFAKDNYEQIVSINLGARTHRDYVDDWKNEPLPAVADPTAHVHSLLHRFNPNFIDSTTTVILIDEIQESPHVYQLIRQIAWEFRSHLIISGSYLSFADQSKEYFIPAGAVDRLDLTPLTFAEFLGIFENMRELYEGVDLYGCEPHERYDELAKFYSIYRQVGGYPEVIKAYLNGDGADGIEKELDYIITIFSEESMRFMKGVVDKALFPSILSGIADIMVREKKGHPDLVDELLQLCKKEEKLNVSRSMLVHAVAWLETCGILGYAHKSEECKFNNVAFNARYYFSDMGIAFRFLRIWGGKDVLAGTLSENFAYLQLKPLIKEQKLIPELPTFGIYGEGEIDFVVFNMNYGTSYGIEVKVGKNAAATADRILEDKILDYIVYAKGHTYGGRKGNKITIPLCLLGRFIFTDYTGNSEEFKTLPPIPDIKNLKN